MGVTTTHSFAHERATIESHCSYEWKAEIPAAGFSGTVKVFIKGEEISKIYHFL